MLAVPCAFVLADVLRRHPAHLLFNVELLVKLASTISIHENLNLFQSLLKDGLTYLREKAHNILEIDRIVVCLFKEANHI